MAHQRSSYIPVAWSRSILLAGKYSTKILTSWIAGLMQSYSQERMRPDWSRKTTNPFGLYHADMAQLLYCMRGFLKRTYFSLGMKCMMDQPGDILRKRLTDKGLGAVAIPTFIRNIANTIADHSYTNLGQINRRLHLLGWNEFELDDYTLQLIIACLESKNSTNNIS